MLAAHQIDGFRSHIHRIHDLRAAFFYSHMLKEFSYAVKQHYSCAFSKISYAEGGDSSDGHEKVFVKNLSTADIFQCSQKDAPSQNEICGTADNQCQIK